MIIDMMLREALTAPVNFWMDLATGDVNVTILQADGTRTDNGRLFLIVKRISNRMNIDEIYTFVIKLGHGDPEGRYALGFAQATMLYLKNPMAVKQSYVDANYDLTPAAPLPGNI